MAFSKLIMKVFFYLQLIRMNIQLVHLLTFRSFGAYLIVDRVCGRCQHDDIDKIPL